MKRIFFIVCLLIPSLLYAGIIMKKSGERLEDVSIKSASGDVITYITEEGEEVSLPKSEVSAILHDDGRYEEIKQESTPKQTVINSSEAAESSSSVPQQNNYTSAPLEDGAKEYNVWAYGVYAGMGYFSGDKYDGITVEYRVIYKSNKEGTSFVYLGTTPFAYATEKMATNSFVGRGNPALMNLLEPKPLVIPNDKDVKNFEIRLSKPGYKTVVVKPFRDVIVGCGPVLMISLDKLKPLKDGEIDNTPVIVYPAAATSTLSEDSHISTSNEGDTSLADSETSYRDEAETNKSNPQVSYADNNAYDNSTDADIAIVDNTSHENVTVITPEPVDPYLRYKDGYIHHIKANEYYYVDQVYDKSQIQSIIVTCPEAQTYYNDARKWMIAGWSGAGGSLALLIMGSAMMAAGDESYGDYIVKNEVWTAGLPFMLLGVLGVPACVTIASIGHVRMNNAYKVFNTSCANKSEEVISLNLNTSPLGIGLALHF